MTRDISQMGWDEFEQSLSAPARGARRGAASEKELREYFGDKEFETLRRLAGHSRHVRSRAAPAGNVVFLHGIMGSNLASVDKGGGEDSIWVHFLRLARGKIARLKLSEDGSKEADSAFHVRPVDVDKRTYARAILFLQARWRVEPFAYDWRKDIDLAADELARFIKQKFKGEPAHLLAHSMGGLVSRNFIRLHREMWESLHDPEGVRGGRLIMLGTPNYGSFAIPQTMTGAEKMVRLLAAADLKHSLPELLEIINTFVGSYQLLPAPGKIPVPAQSLYRCESWGNFKVSEAHLQRAFDFHLNLENDGTIDRERMIYVAGCAQETLAGLTLVAPGEFDYSITFDGDGRVPHTLGLLKDVPTYYVEESHGDLARNETVLSAVDELLERGKTSLLSERPIASRALPRATMRWHRSPVDAQEAKRLQEIAQQADNEGGVPPDIERAAEQAIMRAAFGEELPAQEPARIEAVPVEKQESATLRVEVVLGDITRITASVVAVGHYKGVPPTHAVGAINEALDGWIAKATSRGMVGYELGELFFIPITHRQVGAGSVVLAGMGEFGKFTRDDQMYLLANITHAAGALKLPGFATVLIGAGEGNLSVERALRGMMTGVCEALHRMKSDERITQLTLVEINENRFNEILDLLKRFRDEKSIAGLKLEIASRKTAIKRTRAGAKRAIAASGHKLAGTRITIERDGDVYRYSALSNSAVISVRQVEVQSYFAQGAAERLMTSRTREEQEQYGRLLNTYLVPEDFQRIIDNPPLTLILDRSTAAVPWEMASYRSAKGAVFFGPHLHLARQFRTLLSPAPGLAPALNRQLKVLVIADPAPEPELQLPGARLEGRKVVEVLRQFKGDKKPKDGKPQKDQLDIEVVDRIGATECDPIEILALILNQEFDVVHFAGHGIFDEKAPDKSGWVFGEDRVLSAREIFRARRVPRLVFANACFSAVVRPGEAFARDDTNRQLAGLAEAFFERGIHNYIGAGWPVDDEPAVRFAEIFYKRALDGETLGEALSAARLAILHQGSTWGAYHHYGQAEMPLVDVNG